jgi:hypothetical protein
MWLMRIVGGCVAVSVVLGLAVVAVPVHAVAAESAESYPSSVRQLLTVTASSR